MCKVGKQPRREVPALCTDLGERLHYVITWPIEGFETPHPFSQGVRLDKKLALMNKRESQWHRTAGMRPLVLNVRVAEGQWLRVQQAADPSGGVDASYELCGPGLHELPPAQWCKVTLLADEVRNVLCFFQTGGLSAVSST